MVFKLLEQEKVNEGQKEEKTKKKMLKVKRGKLTPRGKTVSREMKNTVVVRRECEKGQYLDEES